MKTTSRTEQARQTKAEFVNKWSVKRIESLTLEDYVSNGNQGGFCYDIEHNTPSIGSIKGGSSEKFGIYKKKDNKKCGLSYFEEDNTYAWHKKLGTNAEEAFKKVINALVEILKSIENKESLDNIGKIINKHKQLWSSLKWKVVFLYSDDGFIPDIFSSSALTKLTGKNKPVEAYKILHDEFDATSGEKDIYSFSEEKWYVFSKDSSIKEKELDKAEIDNEIEDDDMNPKIPLNQILFGPPGTGKTYNTINKALKIIAKEVSDSEKDEIQNALDNFEKQGHGARDEVKKLYDKYVGLGQIEFVTFHQSYGYEEFIEGIKPKTVNQEVIYDITKGVFARLAKKANKNHEDSKKTIQELSLEKTQKEQLDAFLGDCLGDDSLDKSPKEFSKTKGGKFNITEVTEDNIILFSEDSNHSGKIIELDIQEMLKIVSFNGEIHNSRELAKNVFGLKNQRQIDTYYRSIYDEFKKAKNIDVKKVNEREELRNYILIIDEINRGNISKIFGELITLIEPSKRVGSGEEDTIVKLPYSNESFGVPVNLHIIGTMNTADRSIALMDTALRRRFDFVEMMPDASLLKNKEIEGINLTELLEVMNKRVTYLYDREHQIGHAYLMAVKDKTDLDNVFRNKIIPLLQEYFYDDWEKIQLVLGDHENQNKGTLSFNEKTDCFIYSNTVSAASELGCSYNDYDDKKNKYHIGEKFTPKAYLKITAAFKPENAGASSGAE